MLIIFAMVHLCPAKVPFKIQINTFYDIVTEIERSKNSNITLLMKILTTKELNFISFFSFDFQMDEHIYR